MTLNIIIHLQKIVFWDYIKNLKKIMVSRLKWNVLILKTRGPEIADLVKECLNSLCSIIHLNTSNFKAVIYKANYVGYRKKIV